MIVLSLTPWWYTGSSLVASSKLKNIACWEEFLSLSVSNLFVCFSKVTFGTQSPWPKQENICKAIQKIINVEIPPLNAKMPTPFRLQWSCSYSVPCNQLYHRDTEREQKFRKFSQFVVWIYTRCSGNYTEVEFLCKPHVGTLPILILFVYPCLCLMMKYLSSTSSSQGKNLFVPSLVINMVCHCYQLKS